MSIYAEAGGKDIGVKVWQFPCGEVGVKIEDSVEPFITWEHVWVRLNWESNNDLMALAQLVDILKHAGAKSWSLTIPYFPYSRQDRRCSPGEAHALKVFCTILNSFGFNSVMTIDAHSYVLEALVENLQVIPQEEAAVLLPTFDFLIAPDAGAEKKIFKHAQVRHGSTSVLCASKARDSMGKITSTKVPKAGLIHMMTACVVDDLCDGGATFIELGKVLREANPVSLSLYVTHGMFTKGVDDLFELYDNIYTRNLCNKSPDVVSRVQII